MKNLLNKIKLFFVNAWLWMKKKSKQFLAFLGIVVVATSSYMMYDAYQQAAAPSFVPDCGPIACADSVVTGTYYSSYFSTNSMTYYETWEHLTLVWLRDPHRVGNTQFIIEFVTPSNTGNNTLLVPWYSNSDTLSEANLRDTYVPGDATYDYYSVITDEWSEISLQFAYLGNETLMRSIYNFMIACEGKWGVIPGWVCNYNRTSNVLSSNSAITPSAQDDSASDVTVRVIEILYVCAEHPSYSTQLRTDCLNLAEQMLADHYTYEWKKNTCRSTAFGEECLWISMGGNSVGRDLLDNSSPFMYIGYFQDQIKAMLIGCDKLNETFCTLAESSVRNFLVASNYDGGTTYADFNVGHYQHAYKGNSTHITGGAPAWGSNYFSGSVDAYRALEVCKNLYYANLTYNGIGNAPAIWQNLTNYCAIWANQNPLLYDNTSTCADLRENGTCPNNKYGEYFYDAWGTGIVSWQNTSYYLPKLTDGLKDFTYASDRYGSGPHYGAYNQPRITRSLTYAMGMEDFLFTNISAPPDPEPPASSVSESICRYAISGSGCFLSNGTEISTAAAQWPVGSMYRCGQVACD